MEFPWREEREGEEEEIRDGRGEREGVASVLVRIYTSHVHENRNNEQTFYNLNQNHDYVNLNTHVKGTVKKN